MNHQNLPRPAGGHGRAVYIGYISPRSGASAALSEADAFVLGEVREALARGVTVGRAQHPIEIVHRDSASDPTRATEVATELVRDYKVHLMLTAGGSETVNAVADVCEANAVPCISTLTPWQSWLLGRGGAPFGSFEFQSTFHLGWGVEDSVATFMDVLRHLEHDKHAALLLSHDVEGRLYGDQGGGFPAALLREVYRVLPTISPVGQSDFSTLLTAMGIGRFDVLVGAPNEAEFDAFWTQAANLDSLPRVACIARALMATRSIEALGDLGENLTTEVCWIPEVPYRSSLTGETAKQIAEGYSASTGRQWSQLLGPIHAIFEVAHHLLRQLDEPDDRGAILATLKTLALDTVIGRVDWSNGPAQNVAKLPIAAGQWRATGGRFPYELVTVSNVAAPEIPLTGVPELIPPKHIHHRRAA